MARGITKNTAPRIQSVMDPGPACAAAAIQRVPTMQVMAKSVMSRRPSSRLSWASDTVRFSPQLQADAPQAFGEELRLAADPHAEETLQVQMRPRHDQHTLIHTHALAKLEAGRARAVGDETERTCHWLIERKEIAEAQGPF